MSNNYTKEVLEILEKLGNKNLNLCLPYRAATRAVAEIKKLEDIKNGKLVSLRPRMQKLCPEFVLVKSMTRNEVVKRKSTIGEEEFIRHLALDLAMAYCDLKDIKLQNQSLPAEKQEEAAKREKETEETLEVQYNELGAKIQYSDPELARLTQEAMDIDFEELEEPVKQIGELLGVGDKILETLNPKEVNTLLNTIAKLNSFR